MSKFGGVDKSVLYPLITVFLFSILHVLKLLLSSFTCFMFILS